MYLGMALGRVPGLKLDRTGIALLAVVALLLTQRIESAEMGQWVDLPTLILLMGLMVISAQFALAGVYTRITWRLMITPLSPQLLLGWVIGVAAVFSAFLANDITAFAMAPMIAQGVRDRGLDPRPFLIGLACACNTGSAATLIGNPQNILIAQSQGLDFWSFVWVCAPVAWVTTLLVWAVVGWTWRDTLAAAPSTPPLRSLKAPEMASWQAAKGSMALVMLLVLFSTQLEKEISALAIAGVLLLSRVQSSREMLSAVDWHLLLLFACLFIVTGSMAASGASEQLLQGVQNLLGPVEQLSSLTWILLVSSNSIGNVPAVMLLLDWIPEQSSAVYYAMALLSTLAGNLLLIGSLANIIVAERAASQGVHLSLADHARCGIPITLLSLLVAVLWLLMTTELSW